MTQHALTLPEDRGFKAFLDHPKPGTAGQLLAALHAYRDGLIELGYMSADARGMAADPVVDILERAALAGMKP